MMRLTRAAWDEDQESYAAGPDERSWLRVGRIEHHRCPFSFRLAERSPDTQMLRERREVLLDHFA